MADNQSLLNLRNMVQLPQKNSLSDLVKFSDVPNWRQRELGAPNEFGGNVLAPGRQPAPPARTRWPDLPASQNIEDRRGESPFDLAATLQTLTGFTPSEFANAWANRNEPIVPADRYGKLLPLISSDQNARELGYNDIPIAAPRNFWGDVGGRNK
jgi:hypothetical protein